VYIACQTAIVVLLLTSVPLAARLAGPQAGGWRAAGRGALYGILGSLAAALCSGLAASFATSPNPTAAPPVFTACLPVVLAGVFEEGARILGIWRGRRRLFYQRNRALMFGVGFGGVEMIMRATGIAAQTMQNPGVPLTLVTGQTMLTGLLLAVAVYVFHISMAVIAFRILSDEQARQRAWALFPLMAADHATLNLGAASMFALYPNDAYALFQWSIAAPLHAALALSVWRRTPQTAPRAFAVSAD
jgi:hypothetical protein